MHNLTLVEDKPRYLPGFYSIEMKKNTHLESGAILQPFAVDYPAYLANPSLWESVN